MLNETEPSQPWWNTLQDWSYTIFQAIDLRLALVIGLIAFLTAVSFDSAGNQAEAADLVNRGTSMASPVAVMMGEPEALAITGSDPDTALDQQWVMAQRLRHGTLTSALMTRSRLTQAHFFTDLPSGE